MLYITGLPSNPNMFYTASIQTDFRYYASAGYISKVFQLVNYIKASSYSSSVVWETLTEKYNSWYSAHTSANSFMDNCSAYKTAGIMDMSNDVLFSMYPNPASQDMTIEVGQFNFSVYTVTIYNAIGKTILQTEIHENEKVIDLRKFPGGIYFVALSTKEGYSKSQKLVIE
jgi:Txe/YoeB family toxin of Txe-Axe toxin-antitoxin module